MSERPVSYSQAASFPDPAERVWDILLRFDDRRLYGDIDADIVPDGNRGYKGTVSYGGAELHLSARPYDIKLSSDSVRLGIRVKPAGQICTVLVASSCSDSAPFKLDRSDLDSFLSGLETIMREEYPLPSDDAILPDDEPLEEEPPVIREPAAAEDTPYIQEQPVPEEPAVPEDIYVPEEAPLPEASSEEQLPEHMPASAEAAEVEPPVTSPEKKRHKKNSSAGHFGRESRRKVGSVLAAILLLALTAMSLFFIIKTFRSPDSPDAVPGPDYSGSEKVDMSTALSLSPGDTRAHIEEILGAPSSTDGNASVYCSSDQTGYGTPAVAVQVIYDGTAASRITILDLERASEVGEVTGTSFSGAGSPEELDGLAGTSPSMIRSFLEDGNRVTEYHYGYLDPRMNFSPFWKGQLWASSENDEITGWGTGYAYDGIDPTFHSSMTGGVLVQYSSFDDYLSDFLGYRFCLGMRSQPGRDEMMQLIPSLAESGNVDETSLYKGSSDGLLPDGSPVWSYTAGFGKRGDFVLFSAVNRRLWNSEDMLRSSAVSAIRSGMPFTEAMRCMRILPSMIYIDYSYITLGFGRYLQDSDVLTEQFEFCMRFTLTDDILESVYDNTGTHLDID